MSEELNFYRENLGLKGSHRKKAREAALRRAHEIRQFEIELYWKRANYFWLMQASVFAAVGLTWRETAGEFPELVPLALSSLGLITAWAGWLGTQGSKFWQRNWEHHIDMLETEFEGNLYKSVHVGRSGVKWSLSGVSENLALCFVLFWIIILTTISFWANPNWTMNPSDIKFPNKIELFTTLNLIFAIGGCYFLYSESSGIKGEQNLYPNSINIKVFRPVKARIMKDRAAKPYLLRRRPGI